MSDPARPAADGPAIEAPAIEALGIEKSFAGVPALRGLDFRVGRGTIHALLGQNGAGKSTLVKILNGVHPAGSYGGTVRLDGRPVAFASPAEARARGVAYVPQEIEVFEQLSVAENVFAGQIGLGSRAWVSPDRLRGRTAALLDEIGLAFDPRALVASLTAAQRHLVMIVRALATRPRVLMLDEPTASLSGSEVARLFALLRRLREGGTTMIFITHRLPEVTALCDSATVLRDGRVAAEMARDSYDEDRLIAAMSGRQVQRLYPARGGTPAGEVLLSVSGLSVRARDGSRPDVHDFSFEVRAGEIVGIAGLLGSGRTELLSAIYGRLPHSGTVAVAGRPVRTTGEARQAGIALLTEDRKRSGLLFNLPVRGNITIGNLDLFSRGGLVSRGRELAAALRGMRELKVKAHSPESSVVHLSGGNQQKLLFARVLMNRPKVLLLDEPTKGVDVGTRAEIYRLVRDLSDTGVGVVLVSSEIEEVSGLSDRTLVIVDGRLVGAFDRGEADEERVLKTIAAAQLVRTREAAALA